MIYRILSILICGVFSIGCLAQRVKTVGGEYTYVAPKNMSPEEAERVAFERLKTKLIAEDAEIRNRMIPEVFAESNRIFTKPFSVRFL